MVGVSVFMKHSINSGHYLAPSPCSALILAHRGNYRLAFGTLLVPAVITIALLSLARFLYPRPEDLEGNTQNMQSCGPAAFILALFDGRCSGGCGVC